MKRTLGVLAAAALSTALLATPTAAAAPTLAQTILATSPTYLYQLDEPAGSTTAADSSAVGRRPLELADANAEGRTGTGVTFDGTDATLGGAQYLGHGPRPRMRAPRAFTLALSFQAPANYPGGVRYLAVAQGWKLFLGNTNDAPGSPIHAGWEDRAPQPNGVIGHSDPSVDVATGVHQLVAVGSRHTMTLYLDGSVAFSVPMVTLRRGDLSVGGLPGLAGFNTGVGTVWDVAGWKRALSAADVAALWSAVA